MTWYCTLAVIIRHLQPVLPSNQRVANPVDLRLKGAQLAVTGIRVPRATPDKKVGGLALNRDS